MIDHKNEQKDTVKDIGADVKEEIEEYREKKGKRRKRKSSKKRTMAIMIAITVALFLLCVALIVISFAIKSRAAKVAYTDAKNISITTSYEETGKKIYEIGEKRYHTSNRIGISIGSMESVSALEVLKVTEIEYYIHKGDKEAKTEAWYKITGTGVFTVDLALAEIIVDDERNYILIRVPEPTIQLDDFNVTIKSFHFEKELFESIATGEALAAKAEKEGLKNIKAKILASQAYYDCAKSAAVAQLVKMAEDCNPNIKIKVDVEFFDMAAN